MKELFTYAFNSKEEFDAEDYFDDMFYASKNGKLYIARNIDEVEGLFYDVAEREEGINCVSVVAFDWKQQDRDHFLKGYAWLSKRIEQTKGEEEISVAPYCWALLRDEQLARRIERLRTLCKLDAPKAVIEKEKHSLFEEMIFEAFGESYQDIIFVCGENAPEKGSRADLENERVVAQFLNVYEDVLAYLDKNREASIGDIQKEFKLNDDFAKYLVEQLENNECVWECGGQVVFLQNQRRLKINATPYGRDTAFWGEGTNEG